MTDMATNGSPDEDRAQRRKVRVRIVAVVLVVAGLAYVFNGRFGVNPRLVDSPLVGQPLADLTLDYLEEEGSLSFSELEGQVLVLNVWASWCIPCRYEHPALNAASAAYADQNVHFVGILYQDDVDSAVGFLDEFGRGTNYSYVVDEESRATVELGVFGVPETYFVDAEGIIRGRVQGEVTASILFEVIDDLLAGREPEL